METKKSNSEIYYFYVISFKIVITLPVFYAFCVLTVVKVCLHPGVPVAEMTLFCARALRKKTRNDGRFEKTWGSKIHGLTIHCVKIVFLKCSKISDAPLVHTGLNSDISSMETFRGPSVWSPSNSSSSSPVREVSVLARVDNLVPSMVSRWTSIPCISHLMFRIHLALLFASIHNITHIQFNRLPFPQITWKVSVLFWTRGPRGPVYALLV